MTLLTLKDLARRYKPPRRSAINDYLAALNKGFPPPGGWQVYLGHANPGAKTLFLAASYLEDLGVSFRLEPADFHRRGGTRGEAGKKTLEAMAEIFEHCRSFLFLARHGGESSEFFPWQCGFFAGRGRRVGVLPLLKKDSADLVFKAEGLLSLYPYAGTAKTMHNEETLWLMTDPKDPVNLDYWIARGMK